MKETSDTKRKVLIRLAAYPITFIVVWVPSLINRMQNTIAPTNQIFGLFLIQCIFLPLQGVLNCLVYGWSEGLLKQYAQLIRHTIRKIRYGDLVSSTSEWPNTTPVALPGKHSSSTFEDQE